MILDFSCFVNPYSGNCALLLAYHSVNPNMGKRYEGDGMEYSELYIQRIRGLCDSRGISINALARMAGLKQSTLDNIVRGLTKSPGVRTLHKIALAFGMTLAEFLDFKELNDYSFADAEENDQE